MKNEKKYFTTHQAAKILGVTVTTVIMWANNKKIKVIKTIGKHRRIPKSEIDRIVGEMKRLGEE